MAARETDRTGRVARRVHDEQVGVVRDRLGEVVEGGFKLEVVGREVDAVQLRASEFRHRLVGHPRGSSRTTSLPSWTSVWNVSKRACLAPGVTMTLSAS